MSKSVHIVSTGGDYEYSILAIFTEKERAERYAEKHNKSQSASPLSSATVSEHPVDTADVVDTDTSKMLTIEQAEEQGYTVDTHVYPHFGYKGPRFNPIERVRVMTELEAELAMQLAAL